MAAGFTRTQSLSRRQTRSVAASAASPTAAAAASAATADRAAGAPHSHTHDTAAPAEDGLLSRLIKRSGSLSRRVSVRRSGSARSSRPAAQHSPEQVLDEKPTTSYAVLSDSASGPFTDAAELDLDAASPSPTTAQAAASTTKTPRKSSHRKHLSLPATMPGTLIASPSPTPTGPKLRKRASFRERFWTRSVANNFDTDDDSSASNANAESAAAPAVKKPAYVPRHAASDFSSTTTTRTSIAAGKAATAGNPRSHRRSYSGGDDDRVITVRRMPVMSEEEHDVVDDVRAAAKVGRIDQEQDKGQVQQQVQMREGDTAEKDGVRVVKPDSAPVSAAASASASAPTPAPAQAPAPAAASTSSSRERSSSRPRQTLRHSYNLVTERPSYDPRAHSNAANIPHSHIPSYSQPSSQHQQLPQQQQQQQQQQQAQKPALQRTSTNTSTTSSTASENDYQLFLAQAAAADLAHRQDVWRSLSRHQTPPAAGGRQRNSKDSAYFSSKRRSEDEIKPLKEASQPAARGTTSSAPSTTSNSSPRLTRRFSLDAIGFRSQQQQQQQQEGDEGQAQGQAQMQTPGQGQRTLRRQRSVSQRIAEYIRPPRQNMETAPAYRQGAGLSYYGSNGGQRRRMPNGISEEA